MQLKSKCLKFKIYNMPLYWTVCTLFVNQRIRDASEALHVRHTPGGLYLHRSRTVSMKHWPYAGLMLDHRLRRWPSINQRRDTIWRLICGRPSSVLYTFDLRNWYIMNSIIQIICRLTPALGLYSTPTLQSCVTHIPANTRNQCWFDVGLASQTMGQHWITIGSMSRVCWDIAGKGVSSKVGRRLL